MAQHKRSLEKTIQSAFKHKKAGSEVATTMLAVESMVLSGIDSTAMVANTDLHTIRRCRAALSHKAFGSELANVLTTIKSIIALEQYDTGVAASGVLAVTSPITMTSATVGRAGTGNTFTSQVLAAAANLTNKVLVSFTGTAAAIVCTVTPNDGTNNALVPVSLTTAELVELINTGAVVGKSVVVTDVSSLRATMVAAGGGAELLADAGEGDGVVATLAGGIDMIAASVDQIITGKWEGAGAPHKAKLRAITVRSFNNTALGLEVANMVDEAQNLVDLLLVTYGVGGEKADAPTAAALAAIKAALVF